MGAFADFEDAHDEAACKPEHHDDIGLACLHPDGLYEIFAPDGRSLGLTHGPDPVPGEDELTADAASMPLTCVNPVLDPYHAVVIYARAYDDADRWSELYGSIVDLVESANGILYASAVATGGTASIKTPCSSGAAHVQNAVLPTPKAQANFQTIVNDLTNMGYDDTRKKYWVFYDDTGACTCGGTGHVYNDPSRLPTNFNNGNGLAPMFAVNFGYINSARIMLHELGHNMGAVQNNAPNSTGGYHCTDGRDIMCYNDGGPRGGQYHTNACSVQVWDCNNDDYFHLCPQSGSYLSNFWNLGSSYNRYLQFDQLRLPPYLC